jgi:RNA polymerase sigma-70 factor (ECF subfamily)
MQGGTEMSGHRRFADALVAQLPMLRRYANGLTGNHAHADDLVQDSIERALRQAAQLREFSRIGGWLRRIAYNAYIDELRRRKTKGKEEDIAMLADHAELSIPASDRGSVGELAKAMKSLTIEHREILLLVSVEELNYREIAEELEIPIGTVMSRLARARENLRTVLQNESASIIPFSRPKATS